MRYDTEFAHWGSARSLRKPSCCDRTHAVSTEVEIWRVNGHVRDPQYVCLDVTEGGEVVALPAHCLDRVKHVQTDIQGTGFSPAHTCGWRGSCMPRTIVFHFCPHQPGSNVRSGSACSLEPIHAVSSFPNTGAVRCISRLHISRNSFRPT